MYYKAGNEVSQLSAEIAKKLTKELLWENASPKSVFSGDAILADNNAKEFEIWYTCFSSGGVFVEKIRPGDQNRASVSAGADGLNIGSPCIFSRYITASTQKSISFSDACYYNIGSPGSGWVTSNGLLIPFIIYGIN